MKILLLGDYSNYHTCLGQALASQGHHVAVASDGGGWMKTSKTLSLSRRLPGKAGGALLFFKMMSDSRLTGYDIVSLISPSFVTLKPSLLKLVFDKIKKNNGSVFLGSVGTDKAVMDFLTAGDCPLRYNEYYSSGRIYLPNKEILDKDKLWQTGPIGEFCEYVYDNVDGVTTALYEYHLAMQRRVSADKLAYVGIPIACAGVSIKKNNSGNKLNIFLGRHSHRKKFKGSDRLETAAKRVVNELKDRCRLTIVENVRYSSYIEKLSQADIVLDQLYSYSPATNALLALAAGQTVVSGAEPEYYDFIGEESLRPIINAVPDDEQLYRTIKDLVISPHIISKVYHEGPEFVKKHNDASIVAARCIDFWTSKM